MRHKLRSCFATTRTAQRRRRLFKDKDGRLKRIEYRGKYLRESRTGGVSLRAQTKLAGLNLTANTQHGFRVSTRVARGTNVALQNGRFVLRGRYGKGPTKLNVSKSGVSISSKTSVGTINWFKPRYSSAKIAGIQVRGQNAVYINAFAALFQLAFILLSVTLQLLAWLIQVLVWGSMRLFEAMDEWRISRKVARLQRVERAWVSAMKEHDRTTIFAALTHILFHVATNQEEPPPNFMESLFADEWAAVLEVDHNQAHAKECEQSALAVTRELLTEGGLPPALMLQASFGSLVSLLAARVSDNVLLETFFVFDETIVEKGTRNQLQESLLAVFGHVAGIETDVPTTSEVSAGVDSETSSHGTAKLDDAKTPQHDSTGQNRKESKRITGATVVTIGLGILAVVLACFFLLFSV